MLLMTNEPQGKFFTTTECKSQFLRVFIVNEVGLPGVSMVHVVLPVELRTKLEVAVVHPRRPGMEGRTAEGAVLRPESVFKPHVPEGNV